MERYDFSNQGGFDSSKIKYLNIFISHFYKYIISKCFLNAFIRSLLAYKANICGRVKAFNEAYVFKNVLLMLVYILH